MVSIKLKGDFSKTYTFFERIKECVGRGIFDKYGKLGVEALKDATPVDTGKTANSWDYYITHTKNSVKIVWTNSNIAEDAPVAILLQYGHVTGYGTYVSGKDFINPAMRPVFDKIAEDAWKEVKKQ